MLHRVSDRHLRSARIAPPGFVVLLALAAAASAGAADITGAPSATPAPATETAAAAPSLGQALQAVVEAGRVRLAALEAEAKTAASGEQALAAQAAIIAAKEQMQRDVLTVQLDYARRAGDAKLATELEGVLARLDAPAVAKPQDRPVPADPATTREVR